MVKSNSHMESRYSTGTVEERGLTNSKVGKIRETEYVQLVKQKD